MSISHSDAFWKIIFLWCQRYSQGKYKNLKILKYQTSTTLRKNEDFLENFLLRQKQMLSVTGPNYFRTLYSYAIRKKVTFYKRKRSRTSMGQKKTNLKRKSQKRGILLKKDLTLLTNYATIKRNNPPFIHKYLVSIYNVSARNTI